MAASGAKIESFVELPLRARKAAQTKADLFLACQEALRESSFQYIRVADLCAEVGISEPTFFKYYEKKSDLLVYCIMLWGIEIHWNLRRMAKDHSARACCEWLFADMASRGRKHPRLVAEILGRQARRETPPKFLQVSMAERLLHFPRHPGIEDCPAEGVVGIFGSLIDRALQNGELPKKTDPDALRVSLISILWGVAILYVSQNPRKIAPEYRRQLAMVCRAYDWR
ncbi:MAG: TetR/AcrR family transcriptional regulator [Planctomycetota bacterium]|jgi:AcrR family transcriptional regulator